ncbi:hypothetical protein D9619_002125 [Psilocybe cf. subviscida]|uniref:BTB domain-containing protein n=1 Tax=Psilocybe cf. subviscida TaxID=2480587 RepID=A0A8H5BES5_9AGAR|nr:hypothetical protein D9619_002125 [Psilocybe cf. subviscida]
MASSSTQDPAWFQNLQAAVGLEGDERVDGDVQSAIMESLQQIAVSDGSSSFMSFPMQPVAPSPNIRFNKFFNFTFMFFSVEGIVFTALKEWVMQPGSWFEHLLTIPVEDPNNVEGITAARPLVLEGTIAADFEAFLCFLYPQAKTLTTYEEWLGVLRLATRWDFFEMRDKAIAALDPLISGRPADKIHVGTELRVQKWLTQGLEEFVTINDLSPNTLSTQPYSLDWPTIAKIFYVRMMHQKGQSMPRQNTYCCGSYYGPSYGVSSCRTCGKGWDKYTPTSLVADNFGSELQNAIFVAEDK